MISGSVTRETGFLLNIFKIRSFRSADITGLGEEEKEDLIKGLDAENIVYLMTEDRRLELYVLDECRTVFMNKDELVCKFTHKIFSVAFSVNNVARVNYNLHEKLLTNLI